MPECSFSCEGDWKDNLLYLAWHATEFYCYVLCISHCGCLVPKYVAKPSQEANPKSNCLMHKERQFGRQESLEGKDFSF